MGDTSELAGVVLAAGAGTRLRPLTAVRPKALCTVAGRTLLDGALARLAPHVVRTAVNAHHHADQIVVALAGRDVHVEVERPGRAGYGGRAGQPARVARPAQTSCSPTPTPATRATTTRSACCSTAGTASARGCSAPAPELRQDFGDLQYVGSAALPWWSVRDLPAAPAGLYEVSWRQLYADGRLELVETPGPAIDCGTPADYLRANMLASGGRPVVEPGAVVAGELVRSVVWSGETVAAGERLVDAVRGAGATLQPLANGPPTRSPGE